MTVWTDHEVFRFCNGQSSCLEIDDELPSRSDYVVDHAAVEERLSGYNPHDRTPFVDEEAVHALRFQVSGS